LQDFSDRLETARLQHECRALRCNRHGRTGALRECLLDPDVRSVISIGRSATGERHPKLREIIQANLRDCSAIEGDLRGLDDSA
jgi:hypothetical protein